MGQINLPRPSDGTTNWAPDADALLDALRDESNDQDNRITSLEAAVLGLQTQVNTLMSLTP